VKIPPTFSAVAIAVGVTAIALTVHVKADTTASPFCGGHRRAGGDGNLGGRPQRAADALRPL